MTRRVTFLELTVFDRIIPLASGYMEACARKDPVLRDAYTFEKHSFLVRTPAEDLLATLKQSDADVYAFSCYVWNAALVRKLVAALLAVKPRSYFILGGP